MNHSVKRFLFLFPGACVAALAIVGIAFAVHTPNLDPVKEHKVTVPTADPNGNQYKNPTIGGHEKPIEVLPKAKVIDVIENQPGSNKGLSCNKKTSVPVVLTPDQVYDLDGSLVWLQIDQDGATIATSGGMPASAVIVNERLATTMPIYIKDGSVGSIILPSRSILDGGWLDEAYPELSFAQVVLCRNPVLDGNIVFYQEGFGE